MEAIGTLAGGIAHDFNKILSAILGYAEMARDDCQEGSTVAEDLDEVIASGQRATTLVKQILAFSRQSNSEQISFQPALLVRETVKLLRASMPATIAINQDVEVDCGSIFADPTQIHQVIMNMCTNAFHAMEENGGTLTIALHWRHTAAAELDTKPDVLPGDFIHLSIGDTGQGIPPEIRPKTFDPYFTTKEKSNGAGLGLAITYGIVKTYGGFIRCLSDVGKGTVFDVFLPVSEDGGNTKTSPAQLSPGGSEHILLVGDEAALAKMWQAMLKSLGYRVTTRTSSLEALTTFDNDPDAFDLVMTDQTMPGMTGIAMARRILQIRPSLPIVLCTGFSSQVFEEKVMAAGIKGFAHKPLSKSRFASLIRRVIDAESSFCRG